MTTSQTLTRRRIARYGWVPDIPDKRDHPFTAALPRGATLPKSVDLRPKCPPVYDQGDLGSCTGNAIAAAVQFDRKLQNVGPDFAPSRLFIYYNERVMEGTTLSDSGAMIRDGIKSVNKLGVCPEADWPYIIPYFSRKPTARAYAQALGHKAASYQRLDNTNLTNLKACLAGGFPFIFGFAAFESLESEKVARTGVLPMPQSGEGQIGGHAVMAVGYNDASHTFLVRNSWGTGWGKVGYFTMPYAYLTDTDLSDDFWTIRTISA